VPPDVWSITDINKIERGWWGRERRGRDRQREIIFKHTVF
jgi:hypothetical protein